ncbi:MAG: DUF1343 domain-containing protein [Chitinophagaceae bacterium]|nr:DUF1343 domain-containing protein [Chitinophagaceae bacterium]
MAILFFSQVISNTSFLIISVLLSFTNLKCNSHTTVAANTQLAAQPGDNAILPAAYRFNKYLPLIKGKSVAIFANQTTIVGNKHLIDTLKSLGVTPKKVFSPEHGFRGTADAGETVGNYVDSKTGVNIISLYGNKKKPSADDVKDIDILMFDMQDIGVRYYTYISSLQDYIEAAIAYKKPLIILDRPNPNGFYVDGPVLNMKYKSFIGMQPIPAVYGMTMGEYAKMIISEKWIDLKNTQPDIFTDEDKRSSIDLTKCSITIIKCANYDHNSKYTLPVRPSPNIPDMQSVYLFPSTCFFEGTVLSEGRGTPKPFQWIGHPSLPGNLFSFTPNPTEGAKNSKLYGQLCFGWDLSGTVGEVLQKTNSRLQLKWLLEAYKLFPKKDSFFIIPKSGKMEESFFNRLAGNNDLWQQVKAGMPEDEIRKSWEPKLGEFKLTRKKYLLYKDF